MESQKNLPIIVAGYICGDYFYDGDVVDFKTRSGGEGFIPKGVSYCDSKIPIAKGFSSDFSDFLSSRVNGYLKGVESGGGGENSRKAFSNLGDDYYYIDTSEMPSFNLSVPFNDNSYFAEVSPHAASLIVPVGGDGQGAGTFTLKAGRGDIDKHLDRDVARTIEGLLCGGNDVLVNSISNKHLADLIAENVRGDLYSVITTYLGKNNPELNRLIQKSRVNFFSANEFYWMNGKVRKLNELVEGGIDLSDAVEIHYDLRKFADERRLIGSLVVTMGEYGAIHYNRNNGNSSKWIRLNEGDRKDIQDHLRKQKKSTNSAGDNFTARFIHALKKENASIEEAIISGSEFAIENVLDYDLKGGEFLVDKIK